MGKRNSKKIRKIKKNRSWISIVILVLLHTIIGVIIYAFSCGMLSFFVQNKAFYKLLYMTPADGYEINADMSDKEIEKAVKENISNADKSVKGIIGDNFKSTVHLPFWVYVDVADGNEEFIAKSYINFAMQDLWFFLAFLAFLGILAFIVFVIFLVNIISNIVNQRKVIRLLFTDMVTNGHNKTWFLYKGEQFLRKRRTAKYNYAVINLVFLKYRNFCTCHSVEQGQVLLKKVYSTLGKKLEKREMLAHVSDSDYALLFKYDDIDRLKMRVHSLMIRRRLLIPSRN